MEHNDRIRKLLEDMQILYTVCQSEKRVTNKTKAEAMMVIKRISEVLYEYTELSESLRKVLQ